jgi:uncharacterized protein YegP (UPF0339 family)
MTRFLFAVLTIAALVLVPAIGQEKDKKEDKSKAEFKIHKTRDGKYRWRFVDSKGIEQAISVKTFDDEDGAEKSVKIVQEQAKNAKLRK